MPDGTVVHGATMRAIVDTTHLGLRSDRAPATRCGIEETVVKFSVLAALGLIATCCSRCPPADPDLRRHVDGEREHIAANAALAPRAR